MTQAQTIAKWLREAIPFYRQLGFFQDFAQSDEELADLERRRLKEEWGDDWEPPRDHPDLFLLALDLRRVWWMDMEADVCRDNNVYVQTLKEWSEISRGAFQPEEIREDWKTERGPISVTFRQQGKTYRVLPKYQGDFIDIQILSELNRTVPDSNIRFEAHEIFDQTCFILGLAAEEKRRLRHERGWRFMF